MMSITIQQATYEKHAEVVEGGDNRMNFKEDTLSNIGNTIAFVHVDDFQGQVTKLSLYYMKQLMKLLEILEDMGFPAIEIGLQNDSPLLVFLDKERKTALAIAPRVGE